MTVASGTLQEALQAHRAGDLERAESIYRALHTEQPDDPGVLHLLGVAALQRGDFQAAEESIRRAVAINDDDPLYHSNLGAALRGLGRFDDAADCFLRAIELNGQFAGAHYNFAMTLERTGREDEALRHYRKAVEADPNFADAYLNLSRLLSRLDRYEEAEQCCRGGLAVAPGRAELHFNLGNALHVLDRPEEALECFRRAIELKPDVPEFHNNLGAALKQQQRWDEAAECFREAVRLDPGQHDARYNLAGILEQTGELDEALQELRRVAECRPDDSDVRLTLAKVLRHRERDDEAAEQFQEALRLGADGADAHFGLAHCRMAQGRHEEAVEQFRLGLELDPDDVPALIAAGSLFVGSERLDDAEECYRRALMIEPENAVACYNLGNVYKDLWRTDEALDHYERAIELDPALAEAHINRGVVLKSLGRLKEAVECYSRALEVRPGDAEARFHRALAKLMQGDFAAGWDEYESRWEYEAVPRNLPLSVWDGEPLGEQTLLVYGEQGIGDEIMFASCLPDLLGNTAACVFECDERLVPLFARSFPLAVVVPRPLDARDDEIPACGLQIAVGSLPRLLRRTADDFPVRRRYLAADPQLVRRWQRRLSEAGDGLKVGISWRGGGKPAIRKRRSTDLEQWKPLFSLPGVQFVNLQYGDCDEELSAARERLDVEIHHWDDANPLKDLDGFAAQIAALDLVISIDNSTVHMAGALGVPVWVLLPFAPNWRWMLDRDDSLWYRTVRLFRQDEPQKWDAVFDRLARELRDLAQERERPEHGSGTAPLPRPSALGASPADADTERERRKYEEIWTHDDYRTMSPGLVNADKVGLIAELRKRKCRTILDAGCGTGKLMQKLMTEFGDEFAVHGFDISANCLDPVFEDVKDDILTVGCLWNADDLPGEFDAVLCTDVLEHIHPDKVPAVLENLRKCTRKFAYVAIALFPDGFGPKLIGEPLHLTVEPPNWWFAKLGVAGFRVVSQTVEKNTSGQDMWLHAFLEVSK